jgi:exopolysaccharide biosynthesis glucuronosyltransferase PssE
MIFLTVGTQLPFDRLVKLLDNWNKDQDPNRIFGQIANPGKSGYIPSNFNFKDFIEPDEFAQKYEEAKLIVAHAGMGSIISALTHPKPIVIMPRRADLQEHRNDHQLATAHQFASREGVYVAYDEIMLASLLDELLAKPKGELIGQAKAHAGPELIASVRNFIFADN